MREANLKNILEKQNYLNHIFQEIYQNFSKYYSFHKNLWLNITSLVEMDLLIVKNGGNIDQSTLKTHSDLIDNIKQSICLYESFYEKFKMHEDKLEEYMFLKLLPVDYFIKY